jgi:hypothetical protein
MDFNDRDKLTFNCLIALPKWILMTYRDITLEKKRRSHIDAGWGHNVARERLPRERMAITTGNCPRRSSGVGTRQFTIAAFELVLRSQRFKAEEEGAVSSFVQSGDPD